MQENYMHYRNLLIQKYGIQHTCTIEKFLD